MAQSYKTSISFGLVYIPIALHAVIKNNDIGFNMLHKQTQKRVRYVRTCEGSDCPEDIEMADIVKGYEYEKGRFITITNEELEKLKTPKDESISILQFASLSDIDPIYYDKSYFVVPTGAKKAFELLLTAMEQEKKVAIAKVVLGTKETMVSIRVVNKQMILNTMYFYEEVQSNPYVVQKFATKDEELKLTKTIIQSLTKPFEPKEHKDEYRMRLQAAIEAKVAGEEITTTKRPRTAKVLSLMDALQQTLKQTGAKPKTTRKTKTKPEKEDLPSNVTKMQKRAKG